MYLVINFAPLRLRLRPRQILIKDDFTINLDVVLSGDDWLLAEIDWWYYFSVSKPTRGSQTDEVANQEYTAEYQPT